jgi:hypothetical protein
MTFAMADIAMSSRHDRRVATALLPHQKAGLTWPDQT